MNLQQYIKNHIAEVTPIPLEKIALTERLHLSGQLPENAELSEFPVLVVRPILNNRRKNGRYLAAENYALVCNWKDYMLQKSDPDCRNVYCIITDCYRRKFMQTIREINSTKSKRILTEQITVPVEFMKTPPNEQKIERAEEFYSVYGHFDMPVTVKEYGGKYLLADGYARLIAARRMKISYVLADIVEN